MSIRLFVHRILPISSLLLVVLFKFENCAQAPQYTSNASQGGVVGIVDNYNQTPLTFVANPQLVAQNADGQFFVQGLCVGGTSDQTIEYQVIDMKDAPQVMMTGQVQCKMGGFELPVAKLNFTNCTDKYEVRAARTGQSSQFAVTMLQLDCASQGATEPVAN